MSDKAELEALVTKLTARVDELERKSAPPAPPKPFKPGPVGPSTTELAMASLTMPASAMADLVRAVPARLMRDVMGDARRNSTLRSLGGEPPARPRGSGWANAAPLSNPPGTGLADKLVDAQDARDRTELVEREARRRAALK